MCGLAGYFDIQPKDPRDEDRILKSLAHRGPDARGKWSTPGVGLFHTRLAIVDLDSRSSQPFASRSGQSLLVFNGEIYNFKDLTRKNHIETRTSSDTEILVELLEQKKEAVLPELDGMFSFAHYDLEKRELLLATDFAGKKPLFYFWDGKSFLFASEIKTLVALGAPLEMDPETIPLALFFGYIPAPQTFYKNIFKVPAGSYLKFSAHGLQPIVEWRTFPTSTFSGNFVAAQVELRDLMARATEKRLMADRPLGAFLSGGVDSSVVCLEAQKVLSVDQRQLKTFCLSFREDPLSARYDESQYAREISSLLGTDHREIQITGLFDRAREIALHFDEPFADSSAFPTAALCEGVSSEVKVALSGDGGDEIFGGYDRFRALQLSKRLTNFSGFLSLASEIPFLKKSRRGQIQRFLSAQQEPDLIRFAQWNSFFSLSEMKVKGPRFEQIVRAHMKSLEERFYGLSPLQAALRFNFEHYLMNDLLPKVDRMSMKYGLEVRSPFLDKDLVAFAFSLPDCFKVTDFETKKILKYAYASQLGKKCVFRAKKGFGFPLETFLGNSQMSRAEASKKYCQWNLDLFLDPQLPQRRENESTAAL